MSSDSDRNFDWWSESLIYADLLYTKEHLEEKSLFTKSLSPSQLAETYGGEWPDYENQVKAAYQNSENHYKETDFGDYTSNIVIQHFFFKFLDDTLPISNTLKIHLFHFLNCFLLAVSITIILYWIIKTWNSFKIGIGLMVILSLIAPNFIMYGNNLYWCAWTLFFPTVVMIILIHSEWFLKSQYQLMLLSVFALLAISIKCLFYFEFVSVVMVSMMIPVIFYLLNLDTDKYSLKKKFIYFMAISISAVMGLLLMIVVKYLLLNSYFGNSSEASEVLYGNLRDRLLGNTDSENSWILKSTNVPVVSVLLMMLKKPFINIRGIFSITQLGLILSTFVTSVALYMMNKKTHNLSKKYNYWIACCWISIIAPISWFVMAKPHTYIHNHHCSITWFIIFDFMALSLIGILIEQIIKTVKEMPVLQEQIKQVNRRSIVTQTSYTKKRGNSRKKGKKKKVIYLSVLTLNLQKKLWLFCFYFSNSFPCEYILLLCNRHFFHKPLSILIISAITQPLTNFKKNPIISVSTPSHRRR